MHRLQTVWREFEASLKDGEHFVETQTPIKAQGLQESISVSSAYVHWEPVCEVMNSAPTVKQFFTLDLYNTTFTDRQHLSPSCQNYDEQLERLLVSASRGDFIDPSATPRVLLARLESILQEMSGIRSRLLELSKWEEAITGKHNDLSRMFQ